MEVLAASVELAAETLTAAVVAAAAADLAEGVTMATELAEAAVAEAVAEVEVVRAPRASAASPPVRAIEFRRFRPITATVLDAAARESPLPIASPTPMATPQPRESPLPVPEVATVEAEEEAAAAAAVEAAAIEAEEEAVAEALVAEALVAEPSAVTSTSRLPLPDEAFGERLSGSVDVDDSDAIDRRAAHQDESQSPAVLGAADKCPCESAELRRACLQQQQKWVVRAAAWGVASGRASSDPSRDGSRRQSHDESAGLAPGMAWLRQQEETQLPLVLSP